MWMVATVSTLVPKPIGAVTLNVPSAARCRRSRWLDGAPVSVSVASTTTLAPGLVVPVTVVVLDSMVAPAAGAVMVTGSAAGAGWLT